ncbi:hypothetical protein CJF42_23440, partial [Pseudoalteromonas sp. NBT06-2]
YSVVAARASVTSRGLSAAMALLGGPVGAAVTAALAIAYFASGSDDASIKTKKLEKHVYDLSAAYQSVKNYSALAKIGTNANQIKNYNKTIAKAYVELKKYNDLAANTHDGRTAFGYKQKAAAIKSYIDGQTALRAAVMQSNIQIANFNDNL